MRGGQWYLKVHSYIKACVRYNSKHVQLLRLNILEQQGQRKEKICQAKGHRVLNNTEIPDQRGMWLNFRSYGVPHTYKHIRSINVFPCLLFHKTQFFSCKYEITWCIPSTKRIERNWLEHLWVRFDVSSCLPLPLYDGFLCLALLHIE